MRPVFKYRGNPADQHLVHLVGDAAPFILSSVVNLHILEKRFHIAGNGVIFDVDLGDQGKDPGGYVEITEGPQHIVHGRQLGILDFDEQVEIGAPLPGTEIRRRRCATASHEFRIQARMRGSPGQLVGKVAQAHIGVGQVHAVRFVRRIVHQSEGACGQIELIGAQHDARLVAEFPGSLRHHDGAFFFRLGRAP